MTGAKTRKPRSQDRVSETEAPTLIEPASSVRQARMESHGTLRRRALLQRTMQTEREVPVWNEEQQEAKEPKPLTREEIEAIVRPRGEVRAKEDTMLRISQEEFEATLTPITRRGHEVVNGKDIDAVLAPISERAERGLVLPKIMSPGGNVKVPSPSMLRPKTEHEIPRVESSSCPYLQTRGCLESLSRESVLGKLVHSVGECQ